MNLYLLIGSTPAGVFLLKKGAGLPIQSKRAVELPVNGYRKGH
jgi:hypothetical protein